MDSEEITDLDTARRAVADAFEARIEAAVSDMLTLWREGIEEFGALQQPEIWDAIRRLSYVSRRLQAAAVRAGRVPTEIPHDAEAARQAAVGGISHDAILRSYQIAGGIAWQTFMTAAESVPVDPDLRMQLFDEISNLVRAYEQRLHAEVSAASEAALKEAGSAANQARVSRVRRVVEGYSDSEESIGYRLAATHLAFVIWGAQASAAVQQVSAAIPHSEALTVQAVQGQVLKLWWGWLGVRPGVELIRELGRLSIEGRAQVAFGPPATGLDGFRGSHRRAGYAYTVAERSGQRVVHHRDVVLEGLILQDEAHAREIARDELGVLWSDEQRPSKLRRTMSAYFESGQNAAATAAKLGVSEHTVSRHLAMISEAIGVPVQARRAELELALRTYRLKQLAEARDEGLALVDGR